MTDAAVFAAIFAFVTVAECCGDFVALGTLVAAFDLIGSAAFPAVPFLALSSTILLGAFGAAALDWRSAFGAAFCLVAAAAFFKGADALRAAGAVDFAAGLVVRSFVLFTALLALAEEEALVDDAALAGLFVVLDLACVFAVFKGARAADAAARFDAVLRVTGSAFAVFAFGAAVFGRRAKLVARALPAAFFSAAFTSAAFFLGGMAYSLAGPRWKRAEQRMPWLKPRDGFGTHAGFWSRRDLRHIRWIRPTEE